MAKVNQLQCDGSPLPGERTLSRYINIDGYYRGH